MALLTVTSELRNLPLPSLKFHHLEKKNAQSFKETPASGCRAVAHAGVESREITAGHAEPAERTRLIYSPDASLTLTRLTGSGQRESSCGERARCRGGGSSAPPPQLCCRSACTALDKSLYSTTSPHPSSLLCSSPSPPFLLIV